MTLNSWSSCMTAGITGMHHHVQAIWNQEIEIICICSLMFIVDKIELSCCLWLPPTTVISLLPPSTNLHQGKSTKPIPVLSYLLPFTMEHYIKKSFFFFLLIQLSEFSELRLNWLTPSLLNAHQQHYILKLLVCVFCFISHKFGLELSGTDSVVNVPSKPSFLSFQLKLTV